MNEAKLVWDPDVTQAGRSALTQSGVVSWTYHQLSQLIQTLDTTLRAAGVRPEDSIAVIMPDGAAGLVAQLAGLQLCACAPLNPSLTEAELRHDLLELGVSALICDPAYSLGFRLAEQLNLALIHASLSGDTCQWRLQKEAATVSGRKHNQGAAILLHTSATTGRRKIVPLTSENLTASCSNTSRSLRLTEEDRLLLTARLFHAQGILSALAQWNAGGTVIVANTADPQKILQLIEKERVTWYTGGPTLHQAILTELRKQPLSHTLRVIRSGGNTLSPELKTALRQHLRVPVLDMYGLSETGAVAADHLDHPDAPGWRSLGPGICIMSPQGLALPACEEGEIVVSGPSVMSGYWNDPDANDDSFWNSGLKRWFRTGDLGSLDVRGHLTMSGRAKEIINRGGQKIKPVEIDQALSRHPAIQAVASFGVPHPTLGEDVACAVVLQPGTSASEADLQAFARESLARYKVPRRVHLVPSLPYGATGKPQRLVLRERFGGRPIAERGAGAYSSESPLSRMQRAIAELWAGRLHCSQIRLEDDFFHLGGDSLEAVSMLAEVEALLERTLPTQATERFFEEPTVQMLSTLLAAPAILQNEGLHTHTSQVIRRYPLLSQGQGVEAFLFPADDEEGWYFRLLSRYLGKHRPMSIMRPENGLYAPGPYLVEQAAAQARVLIRQRQPHGPYLLGGFCLGGVIAYETARLLQAEGEPVVLALFDAPMPGAPHPLYAGTSYARAFFERVQAAKRGERTWRRVAALPFFQLRRWLWLALCQTKSYWRGTAGSSLMRWLRRQAEHNYLPLYRPALSALPILHFVMSDRQDVLRAISAQAWSHITTAQILTVPLPGSHHSLFRESNLALMTQAINDWVSRHLNVEAHPAHADRHPS